MDSLEGRTLGRLFVNGTMVASATDTTYSQGQFWIGVGSYKDTTGVFELHVDNLEITQR